MKKVGGGGGKTAGGIKGKKLIAITQTHDTP